LLIYVGLHLTKSGEGGKVILVLIRFVTTKVLTN